VVTRGTYVRGYQESIQLSGAYATRQTSWGRREEGGNRPRQIGQVKGQHRSSPVGHRRIASPPARTRTRDMGTARARRWHAVERGHVARRQPNQLGRAMLGGSQNTGGYRGGRNPVFDRTLPQALPEASSGVSPSQTNGFFSALESTGILL
jgi:hypothetical protein